MWKQDWCTEAGCDNDEFSFQKLLTEKISGTFQRWKRGDGYENEAGFCKSASLEEIAKHDHVLTPGRYVGAAEEDNGEPFAEKMTRLTQELDIQFEEGERLEIAIRRNLEGLGL